MNKIIDAGLLEKHYQKQSQTYRAKIENKKQNDQGHVLFSLQKLRKEKEDIQIEKDNDRDDRTNCICPEFIIRLVCP